MSAVPFWVGVAGTTRRGFWIKFPSLPAGLTALDDWDAGASGWLRWGLNSDGTILVDGAMLGNAGTASTALALSPGQWYWLSGGWTRDGSPGHDFWFVNVYATGGTLYTFASTSETTTTGIGSNSVIIPARFSWGCWSSAVAAGWPDDPDWKMSKYAVAGPNTGAVGLPPTADIAPSSDYQQLYMCRQAVGAVTVLEDTALVAPLGPGLDYDFALANSPAGTGLGAGTWGVKVTRTTAAGESVDGGVRTVTISAGDKITVTAIALYGLMTGVTYYLETAAGSGVYGLAATSATGALQDLTTAGDPLQPPPLVNTAKGAYTLSPCGLGLSINLPGPYAT